MIRRFPLILMCVVGCSEGTSSEPLPETSAPGFIFVKAFDHPSPDLFYLRKDGLELRRLTNDTVPQTQPAVSPDGQLIAYRCGGPTLYQVCIMGIGGDSSRVLTHPDTSHYPQMIDADPAWSPDGRTIAFARRNVDGIPPRQDIWLVDTSGQNETQLTSAQEHERFYQPRFDPRGGRLSATHVVTGSVSVAFIDLVSGQAETFIGTNRMEDDATWHPSGSRLAYVVHDASGSHIEHRRVDGSGKVTSNLTRAEIIGRPWTGARHMTSPAWSPDGREIAGTCAVGDMLTPCRMSLDGKEITFVSPYSPGIDVSWVP